MTALRTTMAALCPLHRFIHHATVFALHDTIPTPLPPPKRNRALGHALRSILQPRRPIRPSYRCRIVILHFRPRLSHQLMLVAVPVFAGGALRGWCRTHTPTSLGLMTGTMSSVSSLCLMGTGAVRYRHGRESPLPPLPFRFHPKVGNKHTCASSIIISIVS